MPPTIVVVNVEYGMPSVREGWQIVNVKIDRAARTGVPFLKLIHGYGSSGVGGKLKDAVRDLLVRQRSEGKVAKIIVGEKWHISDPTTREVLLDYPELERDKDLNRFNEGITIVEVCQIKGESVESSPGEK